MSLLITNILINYSKYHGPPKKINQLCTSYLTPLVLGVSFRETELQDFFFFFFFEILQEDLSMVQESFLVEMLHVHNFSLHKIN